MMKRMANMALAAALAAGMMLPVSAIKVGEVVNHALHTDIVAQINGHGLRSYNVNDRTAVVAEDLAKYGFKVEWDGVERTLSVSRTMDDKGMPEDPKDYPKYEKDPLRAPVGSRAEDILSTDIVTYVAGKQVESFNINGETLVWFSDLGCFGDVTWDAQSRTAGLTLGDPLEHSLKREIQPLVDWAGENADYQLYKSAHGTLFVGYYNGIPHGSGCEMIYVDLAGNRTRINNLLPAWGFGSQYYVRPRNVLFSGDKLMFTTTYQETVNGFDGGNGVWRDHMLIVDLIEKQLVDVRPMEDLSIDKLTNWGIDFRLEEGMQTDPEACLELTLERKAGSNEVEVVDCSVPFPGIEVEVTQSKVVIAVGNRTDPNYRSTPYGKAYYALAQSDIPSMFRQDVPFKTGNTDAQRKFVYRSFQVEVDGQTVSGDMCWIGKNGKRCLRYDFDYNQALEVGSVVTIRMGLSEKDDTAENILDKHGV